MEIKKQTDVFLRCGLSPADLALEAEAGRRNEPMLTVFFPDSEAPLDEDEERPPSPESSSSKFLSGGGRRAVSSTAEHPNDGEHAGGRILTFT